MPTANRLTALSQNHVSSRKYQTNCAENYFYQIFYRIFYLTNECICQSYGTTVSHLRPENYVVVFLNEPESRGNVNVKDSLSWKWDEVLLGVSYQLVCSLGGLLRCGGVMGQI